MRRIPCIANDKMHQRGLTPLILQGGTGHDPLCIALSEPTTRETGKRFERGRLSMRGPLERGIRQKGAWLGGRDTRRLARDESICHTLARLFSRAYNLERTWTWTIGN